MNKDPESNFPQSTPVVEKERSYRLPFLVSFGLALLGMFFVLQYKNHPTASGTGAASPPVAATATTNNQGEIKSFATIEQPPQPQGGPQGMAKFIQQHFVWPVEAKKAGVSGRLILTFVVEKDGSVSQVKVIRDLGMGVGEEAARVLEKMPRWTPGIQDGKKVRVAYTLPLSLSPY